MSVLDAQASQAAMIAWWLNKSTVYYSTLGRHYVLPDSSVVNVLETTDSHGRILLAITPEKGLDSLPLQAQTSLIEVEAITKRP